MYFYKIYYDINKAEERFIDEKNLDEVQEAINKISALCTVFEQNINVALEGIRAAKVPSDVNSNLALIPKVNEVLTYYHQVLAELYRLKGNFASRIADTAADPRYSFLSGTDIIVDMKNKKSIEAAIAKLGQKLSAIDGYLSLLDNCEQKNLDQTNAITIASWHINVQRQNYLGAKEKLEAALKELENEPEGEQAQPNED